MQNKTWSFWYRDSGGNGHLGYIQAPDAHSALRQVKATYGNNLMYETVGYVHENQLR